MPSSQCSRWRSVTQSPSPKTRSSFAAGGFQASPNRYQLRRRCAAGLARRRREPNQGFQWPAHEEPDHQQLKPDPPAERRECDAGEQTRQVVTEIRDERHRRAGRVAPEQLAAR